MSVALSAAFLAGCTTPLEVTGPTIKIAPPSAARDRVVGSSPFTVRTYTMDGKTRKEVGGATCQLRSQAIRQTVQSPRMLTLPVYAQGERFKNRGAPSSLTVSCKAGNLKGTAIVQPSPGGTSNTSGGTNSYTSGTSTVYVTSTVLTSRMSSAYPWSYGAGVSVILE